MDPAALKSALVSRGLPAAWAQEAAELAPRAASGALLYGSRARGDHVESSDVDVLFVVPFPLGTRRTERVSASCYTRDQLRSAAGTLFGMHLARDAVVLDDLDGVIRADLAEMGQPDPAVLFERIRHFAAVLDDRPVEAHLFGRVRAARYLLRTAIYVAALADGRPCFSVRELADRAGDPGLAVVLASNPKVAPPASSSTLADLVRRLNDVVGDLETNQHVSLQNLVVAEWFEDRMRASLGALAAAGPDVDFDYAAIAKVLL